MKSPYVYKCLCSRCQMTCLDCLTAQPFILALFGPKPKTALAVCVALPCVCVRRPKRKCGAFFPTSTAHFTRPWAPRSGGSVWVQAIARPGGRNASMPPLVLGEQCQKGVITVETARASRYGYLGFRCL